MKAHQICFAIAVLLSTLMSAHSYAQSVEWICGMPEDAGEGLAMKGKNPTVINRVTPNPVGKNFKVAVLYFKLSDDSFNSGDCQTQGWNTSSPSPNWMGQFLISTPFNAGTVESDIAAKPNSMTAYWYRMSNGNLWLYGDEHVYTGASITTNSDAASKASWRANNQAILQWYINNYDLSSLDNNSDGLVDMVMLVCRARAKYPYGSGSGQHYTGVADGDYLPSPITISDASNPAEPDIRGEYSGVNNSGVYGTDAYNLEGGILLFAHELGHQIWNFGHRNGLHRWNLMSGAGSPPPTINGKVASAFEKSLLGWLNFTTITTDQVAYELSAMTSANQAISIPVTNAGANNDYFVLEYRRNITHYEITNPSTCPDPGLGEGLLISYMRAGFSGPDIRPADNNVAFVGSPPVYKDGDASDLFPNGGITKITPYTTPNTADRNGNRTGLALLNIQYSGAGNEKVKFDIRQNYWEGTIASNTTWSGNVYVGGNITVNSGVTLTISSGTNVTIVSNTTVTIQGTLSLPSNTTITGGGTIVTSGSGKIYVTSSTDATASNNSRKLVRDSAGNYHLVFESDGEICYEKWINSGTALSEFRRLSSGTGSNKFPSIAERSGKLYVFWQRKTGTNTYDTHFRHFTGTSWDNIRNINTGIASNNDLTPALAVSTPAASFEMMVVYRTNQGLRFRRSTSSTGATWDAAATVTSNTSARNPSLVYKANDYGYFNVTWDEGSNIYHQIYYGGTTWGAATTVSNGTSAYNHQYSSYALSGNNDRHIVWQAFEAVDYQKQTVYHNKNLTNIFTVFASTSWDHLKPSGTGHAVGALTVLCHDSNNNIRKRYYNGSYWQSGLEGTVIASNSLDASASVANPPGAIAEAVWRSSGSAPYTLTVGPSGGLSKSAADENWAYHRRVVFSLNNSATLALQMGAVQLLSAGGKNEQAFPIVSDQDSIKINDLASTLKLSSLLLPPDADSLVFEVKIYGHDAGNLRSDQSKALDLAFNVLSAETGLPLASIQLARIGNTGTSRQAARLVFPVQALRGKQVHLAPAVSNLNLAKVNGALIHVYEVVEGGAQKTGSEIPSLVAAPQPTSFTMRVYPNPFNPSTQIYFYLPSEGVATVEIFDVNGRVVRDLSRGFRKAGNHTVTWDGRDELGKTVASGMYFTHIRFGEERKVAKMMLVR